MRSLTLEHLDQDGWRVINRGGSKQFANEKEVQGFFGLLLQASRFDAHREANNGRGPADFKISMGSGQSPHRVQARQEHLPR